MGDILGHTMRNVRPDQYLTSERHDWDKVKSGEWTEKKNKKKQNDFWVEIIRPNISSSPNTSNHHFRNGHVHTSALIIIKIMNERIDETNRFHNFESKSRSDKCDL